MKPSVYIETTVVSYLCARPSNDPIRRGHQLITEAWWRQRDRFDLFTSNPVLEEASRGDPEAANQRLAALADIPLLELSPQTLDLAVQYQTALNLPARAAADAVHLAIATLTGMEFLLTWNCRHLANVALAGKIEAVAKANGYNPARMATPEQLLEPL